MSKLTLLRDKIINSFNADFTIRSRAKDYVHARKTFIWYATVVENFPIGKVAKTAGVSHDTAIYHRDDFPYYIKAHKDIEDKLYEATGYEYTPMNNANEIKQKLNNLLTLVPKDKIEDFIKFAELRVKSYNTKHNDKTKIYHVADSVADWIH